MVGWLVRRSRQKGGLRRQKSELWPHDYPFNLYIVHLMHIPMTTATIFRMLLGLVLCVFRVCLCVPTYHMSNSYITYVVAVWPYFSWLWQFRQLLCVATTSSLSQVEFEIVTEKQRQSRHDNARLTKRGNARSQQLLMMPTELLTNRELLPGEFLSGLEHLKAR